MKQNLSIYVVEPLPNESSSEAQLQVSQWQQHPALPPVELLHYSVNTEAGDVELYLPYNAYRNRSVLLWALAEVKRLHPKPTDLPMLDTLTLAEQFTRSLKLALEYIEIAEDGRGHNDRSRYLARCLRQIASITPNSVGSTAKPDDGSSDAQAVLDS